MIIYIITKRMIVMKLMFASDIHGSAPNCALMLRRFEEEKAEKLFLLGDILYHGPRNGLTEGYDPKEVSRMLNERKNSILCVRGNCDSEVDQMMLEFPIMAEYALLFLEGRTVFLTHGHRFNTENPPLLKKGDILLHGHTHIQMIDDSREYIYINPGSVAVPKEGRAKSYMVYENGVFTIKKLENADQEMQFTIN